MAKTRYICGCCGAEIDIKKPRKADFAEGWSECMPPEGISWKVPAGKKELSDGSVLYMDTYNNLHQRLEFIELFGVDPERSFLYMRNHIQIKKQKSPQIMVEDLGK
jgi:hypothetical protein